MLKLFAVPLLLTPLYAIAQCSSSGDAFANSEMVLSVVPMAGEMLEEDPPQVRFEVDVWRVWKGQASPRETILVEDPTVLDFGSDYILGVVRNTEGEWILAPCSPILNHGYREWAEENLGEPIRQYQPRFFRPRR